MQRRITGPVLAALLVVASGAAGCGSSSSSTPDPTAARGPATFALALGIDADDPDARAPLGAYDLVVVDGEGTSEEAVEDLQAQGATVLAYLSAGTVEPGRPWFATAEDEGWLLDHWDDWDEWYAEVSEPGMRDLVVDEAGTELAKGFDGLFLDNTDMVQGHPDQREGMIDLVAALDELVGSERLLFAQNGDPVEAGIADLLDGWNREDVSTTYDFDAEAYAPVSPADHRDAVDQLEALHDRGLTVTATDYSDGSDTDADAASARAACRAGAIPNLSDIGLTRIPAPPLACSG
jgi:uncharacterized protein (TIGR01370 family)